MLVTAIFGCVDTALEVPFFVFFALFGLGLPDHHGGCQRPFLIHPTLSDDNYRQVAYRVVWAEEPGVEERLNWGFVEKWRGWQLRFPPMQQTRRQG